MFLSISAICAVKMHEYHGITNCTKDVQREKAGKSEKERMRVPAGRGCISGLFRLFSH